MTALTGGRRKWTTALALGIAPLLLAPTQVFAIFPPVILQPRVGITGVPVDPPIVVNPPPPPIISPPAVGTPEPTTLVTGLIGLVFGGYALRRKKSPVVTVG